MAVLGRLPHSAPLGHGTSDARARTGRFIDSSSEGIVFEGDGSATAGQGHAGQAVFEPTNGGFADQSWIAILLVRLAFTPAHLADFAPDLGPIVPKLLPSLCELL